MKVLTLATSLVVLAIAAVRPAAATPFVVGAQTLSAVGNLSPGASAPSLHGSSPSISGWEIQSMNPPNWAEFTFTAPGDGLYTLKMNYATPLTGVGVTIDVHASGSPLHYAVYGVSTPNSGDWSIYTNTATITVPLKGGSNVIRVENVLAFNTVPHSNGNTGNGVNIGGFTLEQTGALPATSSVSGTVSSSDLGIPVGGAIVMVEAPAKTVAEPGFNWYNGYWTTTADDGTYSIPVPAGNYSVQAGRPDTYAFAGATKTGVTAGSSGNNLSLTSRWASNALLVSTEYHHAFGGNGMGTQTGAFGSIGYALGWTDPGDYVDLWVDVAPAQAGWYSVDHIYQNGGVTGTVSYITDRFSTSTDTTPNTGDWGITGTKRFANPIYLFPGKNSVREIVVAPNSNISEFKLTKTTNSDTSVRVKLWNYVNHGCGSSASPTGGSGGVNISPSAGLVGIDGLKVTDFAIGGYSVWSTGGVPEYLEYNINAPKTGFYTFKLRGGTPVSTVTLRVSNLSYGMIVDNQFDMTGTNFGEDTFNTLTGPNAVPLIEGPNRIRVAITDAGMNADWVEFDYASDLTGWGKVSGVVTAAGNPVAWAQVSTDVSADGIAGVPTIGFRAITDSLGRYSLYAPAGVKAVEARALGYDDATQAGASASLTLAAGAPLTQNFTLTLDNKYEAEWFTTARSSDAQPSPDGYVGVVDDPAASQGQKVGSFGDQDWVQYTVIAPTAGIYSLSLNYARDGDCKVEVSVPGTGTDFIETVPTSGGFNSPADYVVTHKLVLNAGANTIRLTNVNGGGEINVDYFTLTATGAQAAIVTGTVTNTTATPNVPIPGVSVTATDSSSTVVGATTTDSNGAFAFALPPDTYTFTATKTGYTGTPKSTTVVAGSNPAIALTMTQGLIKGYVKDQLGVGVADTWVRAYPDASGIQYDPNDGAYAAYKLNEIKTDANGYFELAVRQGSAVVTAGAAMSIPDVKTVSATPVATVTLNVTRLLGGTPINVNFDQDFFNDAPNSSDHSVPGIFFLPGVRSRWTPPAAFDAAAAGLPYTFNGVPFKLGNPTGNNNNVLTCLTGTNEVTVPAGKYAAAVVICNSGNGNWPSGKANVYTDGTTPAVVTFSYSDGSTATSTGVFQAPNWYYPNTTEFRENAWKVLDWQGRSNGGSTWEEYPFMAVAEVLPVDSTKTLTKITFPVDDSTHGNQVFIYAVTLAQAQAVPPSALTTLKIAAGLSAAGASDVTVNDTDADSKLTVRDAVKQLKAGNR